MPIESSTLTKLVCPVDKSPVQLHGKKLISAQGRDYPVRLPFANETMDVVFSYSVRQHFAQEDVLRPGGRCLIQMANTYGIRCLYHQTRRGFKDSDERFSVHYWTPSQLKKAFTAGIGETNLSVDGYFNLNPQPSETKLLPWRFRAVVSVSETLRQASHWLPPLTRAADSLYISATKK